MLFRSQLAENYRQNQESINYTRSMVRKWFTLRPEITEKLGHLKGGVLCHQRLGDYAGLGFTVVSPKSYLDAADKFGNPGPLQFVSEENPHQHPDFQGELSFVPDFVRLMNADVLFRANSTFSWWAATLGTARVFSPVIDGKGPGEQDCEFVDGNWPRTFDVDFVTNLHLKD